jgi:hypothetical protein
MDNNRELKIDVVLRKGRHLFLSYNNLMIARAEADYLLTKVEQMRDESSDNPRPFVIIEEAHKIFSGRIEDFIAVCRKLSVGVGLCMPIIPEEVREHVLGDIKNILVGKLKGKAYNKVASLINDPKSAMIPGLKSNMFTGERELLYYNGHWDMLLGPINMYLCPQEIHREV